MSPMKFCPWCGAALQPRKSEDRERLACSNAECSYVFYDNPTPVLAAVVEHDGMIVLVRNVGWPEKWFGLLTGFLERGERPEEGILREVREEIGLDGEIVQWIGAYAFEQRNEIILAWHVRVHGEIKIGAELAGVKAVHPDKLRAWPFGTGEAVRDWLAMRARAGSQ